MVKSGTVLGRGMHFVGNYALKEKLINMMYFYVCGAGCYLVILGVANSPYIETCLAKF